MVATRKNPSAPAPPTSRTNSTQALPRAVKAKTSRSNFSSTSSTHPEPTSNFPNGTPPTKHKTKSQKSTYKTPPARLRKRSLLDRLFLLFLTTFTVYALYTCPSDSHKDNLVCRSLRTYHTHVLEPYVIPPIRAAITHPTIAQPYEKYAKPVYQSYIEPATPYLAAAHRRTAPYVNSAIHLSQVASSRVWNIVLKPYWTRAVVPRYTLYLQPHVNKYVNPLIRRAKHYSGLAEPYVHSFIHQTTLYTHQVHKYALIAYDRLQPYASHAFAALKPYALRGYAQVKPLICQIARFAQSGGKHVASRALFLSQVALGRFGDLRREFVDPHVLRIWEKAVEKSDSSGFAKTSSAFADITTTPAPTHSEVSVSSIGTPAPAADIETSTVKATPDVTLSSFVTDDVISTQDLKASDLPILDIPVPSTPVETLEKAESIAEASAAHASNVIAGFEAEIKEAEAAQAVLSPSPTPTSEFVADDDQRSESPSQPDLSQETASSTGEADLDDFFRDIGLDEEENAPEPEPEPEPVGLSPEEEAEAKKAATAAKRANIVGRHLRWQAELDSLVKDLTNRVRREIEVIRKEAVAHVGKLPSDKDSSIADAKGKEVLDEIQNDGEKLLKGLEAYVGRLSSQVISRDELEKEKEKWDKVVDKVQGKFKDVVRGVHEEVHEWYLQIKEQETSAVMAAVYEAKTLADNAQTDIGLDYAWLDDVTYEDWQKYHDLMRTYERFGQTARSLQNGTHPDPPEDKLVEVLDRLDREVQRLVMGFIMRMNPIVREGNGWFSNNAEPVPEPETNFEDEEVDEECEEEEEDPISILPIFPEPSVEQVDPANIMIGKSPEQIEKMAQQAVVDQRIEL